MGAEQSLESQKQTPTLPSNANGRWLFCSSQDPFSKTANHTWEPYKAEQNDTIEQAFLQKKDKAVIGTYFVDFKRMRQIHSKETFRQRPVRREEPSAQNNTPLPARFFVETPKPKIFNEAYDSPHPNLVREWMANNERTLGRFKLDEYGNVVSDPEDVLRKVAEQALRGIIEEGNQLNKEEEASKIVQQLERRLNESPDDALKIIAFAYASQSFLYNSINSALQEEDMKKVNTLGPLCYLLNIFLYEGSKIFEDSANVYKGIVYRGANIKQQSIQEYSNFSGAPTTIRWDGFVSTTKDRNRAEQSGNILFIIELEGDAEAGYGVDISKLSPFGKKEEEVLLPAGSLYTVQKVELQGPRLVVNLRRKDPLGVNIHKYLYTLDEDDEEEINSLARMLTKNEDWDTGSRRFNTLQIYRKSGFVNPIIETTLKCSPPYNLFTLPEAPQTIYSDRLVPIGDEMVYVGEWNEVTRKPEGRGVVIWRNGRIYEGFINNFHTKGLGRTFIEDGSIYEGEFQDLNPNGKGKYTWGHMTSKFGDIYEGDIKDALADGEAILRYRSGDVYKGQWKQGERSGKGEMTYADGRIYKGDWFKDKKHGLGTYTWKSNRSYTGEFVDGYITGKGTLIYSKGKKEEGIFEKGILASLK